MLPKVHPVHNIGQSLIEVLVALALAVLAIGALVSVTMTSVKNAQFSKNQIQAEKFAQEGMEWIRLQKETLTWTDLTAKIVAVPKYCINNLDWSDNSACAVNIVSTIFKRELDLSLGGDCPASAINAKVSVLWVDSSGTHNATRETCFTDWK